IDGHISARDRIKMMSTGAVHELLELGVISPEPVKSGALAVGEVGYLITGVKDVRQSRVGDPVTINSRPAQHSLGGYNDRTPVARVTVLAPNDYVGAIMELCQGRRGALQGMDYLSADRVELRYTLPLGEIIFDFFDQLKSRTKGYASLDYEPSGEQLADLVKV